jgi:hypothetical protein
MSPGVNTMTAVMQSAATMRSYSLRFPISTST